jgi:hypothetical protein
MLRILCIDNRCDHLVLKALRLQNSFNVLQDTMYESVKGLR